MIKHQKNRMRSTLLFLYVILGIRIIHATNGGVLPYAWKDGKVLICLGYEGGKSSWSDFGGSFERGETTEETAAREAHEESIGKFFKPNLDDTLADKQPNYNDGCKFMREKFSDENKVYRKDYTFFIVEVPYVAPADFLKTFATVKKRGIKNHYLEKKEIAWVEVSTLKEATKGKYSGNANDVRVNEYGGNRDLSLFRQLVIGLGTKDHGQRIMQNLIDQESTRAAAKIQAQIDALTKVYEQKTAAAEKAALEAKTNNPLTAKLKELAIKLGNLKNNLQNLKSSLITLKADLAKVN